MSDMHGQPHEELRQEEDRIAPGKIVAVGVGALVIFFLASFVTIAYVRLQQGERPPLPVPPELGQSKIGLVEQQPFESAHRGAQDRQARLERLRSYGWADRRAGVVHLPIERAMELTANGVRPRPAAPERTTPEGQP